MAKNYYEILGVDSKATQAEIKSAYRKLVKQYHPDLHPNDPNAAAKFKEINEANEVLSDEQKRAAYDYELANPGASNFGGFSGQGFGGFGGFSDIFNDIFSGFGGGTTSQRSTVKERGKDITVEVSLSFLDAAKGCSKDISYSRKERCNTCKGTGAKNATSFKTCEKCGGSGQVQYTSGGGFFRTVSVRACPECGGTGKKIIDKCPDCGGKGWNNSKQNTVVHIDIPAGADTNSYIRKKGYGHASTSGGEPGDLIVVFKVLPHKIFKRERFDLYVDLPLSYVTCVLGGKVMIPTLDDAVELEIPLGTQPGKQFVLRGKGIRSSLGNGNLYVKISVEVPNSVSRTQRKALENFAENSELKQCPKMKDYSENLEALYGVKAYEKNKK